MSEAHIRPVLAGQKALVVGVANDQSIAYGCAKAFRTVGAELAITWLNERARAYVAWVLRPVQPATAPFVELLRAIQTTKPAIALRGALRPLLDRCRSAIRATHLASPPSTSGIVAITSSDQQSPGVMADRT
jgi:hypothetical protein